MHGDDHGDSELGDAEDLVGLLGLPQGLAQGRDEQVPAVPRPSHPSPVVATPVLIAVDGQHPAGPMTRWSILAAEPGAALEELLAVAV
jgi:hypothetical protein